MPQRQYSTLATANTTVTTTTETIVATLSGVDVPSSGGRVLIAGVVQLTTGVATTTVTPRIRRGTAITDPLVGEANAVTIPTAAGGTDTYSLDVSETPGELVSTSYVLTVQQAAATGNGTALQATLSAEVTW